MAMNMFGGNTVNDFNIQEDLDVDGNVNIDGNLTVIGDTTFTGSVSGVDKIEDDDASTSITTKTFSETLCFTTNSTARATISSVGNFIVDTDTIYVDAVNDRVGINKIPSVNFDVAGLVNTDTDYQISNTSVLTSTTLGNAVVNSSLTSVGTLTSLTMTIDLNITTGDAIIQSGSLAIGNFTPIIDLAIGDTDTGLNSISDGIMAGYSNNSETFRWNSTGLAINVSANPTIDLAIGDDNTGLNQEAEDELAIYTGGSEVMRFDSGGFVGIGDNNPTVKLSILSSNASGDNHLDIEETNSGGNPAIRFINSISNIGRIRMRASTPVFEILSSSTNGEIYFTTNSTERVKIENDGNIKIINSLLVGADTSPQITLAIGDSNTGFSYVSSNVFRAMTGGQERMRFDSNGVGIGSSPLSGTSLYVSNGNEIPLQVYRESSGTGADIIRGHSDVGGTDTLNYLVEGNGNNFNTNNSYGGLSDLRLKENITDCNSQWNDIKGMRFVNFNFITTPTQPQLGLIAQEVELVSSGLVEERDDEINTKVIKYSVLYMKGMKALQEAMTRIETLEGANTALLSIITTMNDRITALENP